MIQQSTVQALLDEAGLQPERVLEITIQPGIIRFTVLSVDPLGSGMYFTGGTVRTHHVDHVIVMEDALRRESDV